MTLAFSSSIAGWILAGQLIRMSESRPVPFLESGCTFLAIKNWIASFARMTRSYAGECACVALVSNQPAALLGQLLEITSNAG
jgi:hypothetical protein